MVRKILMCGALMERYLRYNDEFHLAICQACRVGLPANNVLRHIRMHHSSTWTLHKKLLKTYVKALNLISLEELATIQPDGIRDPIPGINVTSGWCYPLFEAVLTGQYWEFVWGTSGCQPPRKII
jgi:Orsellinic acid/F9775 biosynthesis cluster protein D